MSTVVNNFSQLETMVSITSFENACDSVSLLSNSETYWGIGFYFKHCSTKTFPVFICDNSYWTSVIFNCRRLVKNRQRLCTSTVHATITFTVAAIATSVRRAYMRVIIKGGKKQLPYILLGLKDSFMSLSHSALCFPRYTMTL